LCTRPTDIQQKLKSRKLPDFKILGGPLDLES
jgi:hypothetical protein